MAIRKLKQCICPTCGQYRPQKQCGISVRSGLTDDKVREIRARVTAGEQQKKLAIELGLSRVAIHKIVARKTWDRVK